MLSCKDNFCHSSIKMPANNSLDTSYDIIRLYTQIFFIYETDIEIIETANIYMLLQIYFTLCFSKIYVS